MSTGQLIGRSSSHFTRVPRIFAHELGLELELVPVRDVTSDAPGTFGGNPALKLPTLQLGDRRVFGAQNICRALAALGDGALRIAWPEAQHDDLSRNAHELVWHGMAAQVQLVMGTLIAKLPADNVYFTKGRAGFEGALRWLDAHLAEALRALPPRDLSLFEVALFCLVDHVHFRQTLPLDGVPALARFREDFAARPSARATAYRFD